MLELALGQFSGLGPSKVFYRIAPIFQGVGYASVTINIFVGFYYNVIIAYCLYYFFLSMTSTLPWSSCDNSTSWVTANCITRDLSMNCSTFNQLYRKNFHFSNYPSLFFF
jgi:SNF family Na+-dependent transporter